MTAARRSRRSLRAHARRSSRPVDRSGRPAVHVQRERRRLLPDRPMPGKTWKFAVAAGGSQFYNVDGRHEHSGLGVRLDPGRRQPAGPARSEPGTRPDRRRSIRPTRPAVRGRNQAIDPAIRTSCTRTGSTETSRARTSRLHGQRGAAAAPVAAGGRAAGATADTAIRPEEDEAAGAVDGADRHFAARSEHRLRRLSVRVPLDQSR